MQKIKLDIAKNHALQWNDFTVLPGMIKGIDENGNLFVTSGKPFNNRNAINIYFIDGLTLDGRNNWIKKIITKSTRHELLDAILKFADRRDRRQKHKNKETGVKYLCMSEHEAERWGKREITEQSIIYGNCKSNHYLFSTDRIGKERRVDRCIV